MSEEKQKKKLSKEALDKTAGGWKWEDLNPFKKKSDTQLDGFAWGPDDEVEDMDDGTQHIYDVKKNSFELNPFDDNNKI